MRVVEPPNRPFVVQATVPILLDDTLTLQLDDYASDSRIIGHTTGASGEPRYFIYEVVALAGANDASFIVHPGTSAPAGALSQLWPAARALNLVRLELADDAGAQVVSLTGQPIASMHRRGNVMRTSYSHIDLGRFGYAHLWTTARAATQQLDFVFELHNGIPGPDRRINSIRVRSAYPWRGVLPDPAHEGPYLLKPGTHQLRQQQGRPFRFSVGLTNEPVHVGVADWSQGGFLPSGLPVPPIEYDHGPLLAQARAALASLAPWPSWAAAPPSVMYPCSGVTQGDEGGGYDRLPLLGARWAATGDPDALELYQIEQLRSQARARRRYGLDGAPVLLPAVATWEFYDRFLPRYGEPGGLADAPWEWDRWPTQPFPFAPTGMGSLSRELNDNLALAWLANDPLARMYVMESATRARLTFPALTLPAIPHIGTYWNGAYAQAALACIAAKCLGATEHDAWLADFIDHLRLAQMPSGIFEAHDDGYPGD